MKQVEIIISDMAGRFTSGEIGTVLPNDYASKYDYKVQLPGKAMPFFGADAIRVFYFHKEEVRAVDHDNRQDNFIRKDKK